MRGIGIMIKNIKTVVFDMDGTALNEQKEMDKLLVEYSQEIKDAGVDLMIASGRLEFMVYNYMEELQLNTPIIGCNGGTITYRGVKEPLHADRLPAEELQQLIAKATEMNEVFHVFTLDGLVGREVAGRLAYYNATNPNKRLEEQVPIFVGEEYLTREALKDAVKFLLVTKNREALETIRQFASELGFEVVESGEELLDIMAKGNTKGSALEKLAQKGIIDLETTMVFGDNYNDIEMFEAAKYPIVMANATDEIKKYAYDICDTNEENGVGKYVLDMLGIERK